MLGCMEDTEINIHFKDVIGLEPFLSSRSNKILVINTCNSKLELVRIFNIFQQLRDNRKHVYYSDYFGADNVSILNWTHLKKILNEDDIDLSKLTNITIIDVLNHETVDKAELNTLFERIFATEMKKIILVCAPKRICLKCSGVIEKYDLNFSSEKKITRISFQELTSGTQAEFLSRPCISFQGNPMTLKELLNFYDDVEESLNNIITTTVLNDIIFHQKVSTLVEIGGNKYDDKEIDLYIQRRFQNSFFVCNRIKTLLTSKTEVPDKFIFCGINDKQELLNILRVPVKKSNKILNSENIIIIPNEEEASAIFNDQPSSPSVHLIRGEENRVFSWMKSKGSLEELRKFTVRNMNLTTTQENLLKKKSVILSGPLGIGKTITLAMLSANLQLSWIINVDLSINKDVIRRMSENIDQQNTIDFLSNWIAPHFVVSGLLNNYLFNVSKLQIYILFDGFDELADNLDFKSYRSFIDLLRFLKEKSLAHIWITTRPENSNNLENALSEFSTHFAILNVEEQKAILSNSSKSKPPYIDDLYENQREIIANRPACLGLPFLLKILHENYITNHILDKYENVCDIIGVFIEFKIRNYMDKNFVNNNHKEDIVNYLNAIHGYVASRLVCAELDEILGRKESVTFHVDISKIGFVEATGQNSFRFVHRIFAEYFVASMFYKWVLDPKTCLMEQLLLFKICLEPQYKIIRLFLNHRIRKCSPPAMPQCVTERLVYLWQQRKGDFFNNKGECALHVLIKEGLSYLVQWFFPKDFIECVLPMFSTRYKLFSSHLFYKIQQYTCIPTRLENLITGNDNLHEKLFLAVKNHRFHTVKNLLFCVDDVIRTYISTSRSKSVLHLAAFLGLKDVVEYLIDVNLPIDILDSNNATPLQYASSNGHLDIVKYLTNKGSNINNRDRYLKSSLSRSAERGHLEVLKFLVEQDGINKDVLDRNGTSVLQHAVKSGHLNVVTLLLDKGFDVNHIDYFGLNALAWAVITGDVIMTDYLMSAGADSRIKDQHGSNLVHLAVKARQWHMVKYLTFCLIDVNVPDNNNITSLERAVKFKKWDIVEHLILEGAQIQINNRNGFNSIHWAAEHDEWALALLMIQRGGSMASISSEKKGTILDKAVACAENLHSAFIKIIQLGNVELLKLLILQNGLNDPSRILELDRFLAEPYEELILINMKISDEMKKFIEGKLVQLRSSLGQKVKLTEENIKERIQFVCEQINNIKYNYFTEISKEVDQEFILRVRFIAQNIHLLKRSLRNRNIPWEEMEFCLVTFMKFFLKPLHEDFEYRLVLDQERLITYLVNFSQILRCTQENTDPLQENLKDIQSDYKVMKDIYSLNRISFYIKLALSINKYEDSISPFVLMRCLQVIGESFKNTTDSPNLSNDVHNYLMLSAPINVKRVVTSLRDSLSHSHTYKSKAETESALKSNPMYFQTIQNDLKKIRLQIDMLLYSKKKETLKIFHTKCLKNINNPNGLKNINRYINWDCHEKITLEDYEIKDLELIKNLVRKLKQIMQDPNEEEQEMLNKLTKEIFNVEKVLYERLNKAKREYVGMRSNFTSLNKVQHSQFIQSPNIDFCTQRREGIYYNAVSIIVDFLEVIQTKEHFKHRLDAVPICSQLCYIMKWDAHQINSIQDIDSNLTGKLEDANETIVDQVLIEIQNNLKDEGDRNLLHTHFVNMKELHDRLGCIKKDPRNALALLEQLNVSKKDKENLKKSIHKNNVPVLNNIIGNLDLYSKLLKSYSSDKFYKILKGFFSPLRSASIDDAISQYIKDEEDNFKCIFINKFTTLKEIVDKYEDILSKDLALQSVLDILLLDIMEACISKGAIIEYVLSFDEFAPLLVGTALRNYVAHGTPLIDVLPFDPTNAKISIVKLLMEKESNLFVTAKEALQYSMQDPILNFIKYLEKSKDNQVRKPDKEDSCKNLKLESKENALDSIILNDDLQYFDFSMRSRCHPLYEYFLKAAISGDLNHIKHITGNLIPTKQNLNENQKSKSIKIINTAVIWPAIILASKNGHENVVETLLNIIENSNITDKIGTKINSFIYENVEKCLSKYEVSIKKLSNGSNMVAKDSVENCMLTAFYLSAINGHHGVVKILFKFQPNIDIFNRSEAFFLHLAAESGHEEVVNILLENNGNVNTVRADLTTPLHLATANGHIGTVNILLQHNADVNAQQKDQLTPLHISATHGYAKIAKLLLGNHASVDVPAKDQSTALHLAAQNNYIDVTKVLLKYNANVNALDYKKITPIHLAAASGHEEIVEILLENSACIDWLQGELTPLHIAALYGQPSVAKLLLKRQACVDAKYKMDLSSLHLAASAGNSELVEILLNYHANVNVTDNEYFTPLHFASQYGHKKVVEMLIEHQANINAITVAQITALYLAASHGHEEVVKYLLEHQADINVADNTGRTPLHISFLHRCEAVVRVLLENNANVNALTEEQATPLHFFAQSGQEIVVQMLIEYGADVNAKDNDLFTPLHLSAQNNHEKVAKILIEHNANVNAMMVNQATPLHTCAANGHVKIVKLLLENNGDVDAVTTGKYTPLHISTLNGQTEVAKILLNHHTDVNAVSNAGTALHISSQKGYSKLVQLLLDNNADINIITEEQGTPLHLAAKNGHEDIVKLLILHQTNVDACTSTKMTPLHFAALNGHEAIVKTLLESKANINTSDEDQMTPLHTATKKGHGNIVKLLLSQQAYVNTSSTNSSTPLHDSASQGFNSIMQSLLEHHGNVNTRTNEKVTPLHLAAENGHQSTVKMLLQYNAEIDAVTTDQSTPLHLAAKNGHLGVVNVLLENHADVNAHRIRKTPLFALDDNNITYTMKETALTIAQQEGHQAIVSTLLVGGAVQELEYQDQ